MKPKKSKELIQETAKDINLPVKVIEDIVNFYWREVWENLTVLKGPKVHIDNLGDFNIKHWLLDKEIARCEGYQEHTSQRGAQKYVAGIKISQRLEMLTQVQHKVLEEKQRKEFIYQHKQITNETTERYYPDAEGKPEYPGHPEGLL